MSSGDLDLILNEALIRKEVARLKKNFAKTDKKRKAVSEGLIYRAAFMRVSLEDLEKDLNEYGWTEMFSQGNQEPYLRKRPQAELYNSLNANYQKIVKLLSDLLPKEEVVQKDDGFEGFTQGRDD